MKLPALVCFSQQDVYMLLMILACTVNCRFRFADCPLIHCVTAKLICVFVFAYAKCSFSHDSAHMLVKKIQLLQTDISFEPRYEKTSFLYMRKQRRK